MIVYSRYHSKRAGADLSSTDAGQGKKGMNTAAEIPRRGKAGQIGKRILHASQDPWKL